MSCGDQRLAQRRATSVTSGALESEEPILLSPEAVA
jgi:hypothetical protein